MRQRVLTSILLAPIVLLAVASTSPWPVFALCAIALLLSLAEIKRMLRHSLVSFLPALLFLLGTNLLLVPSGVTLQALVAGACLLFGIGVLSSWWSAESGKPNILGEGLDGLWAAMPLFLLLALHQLGKEDADWSFKAAILLVLLPVWAGDIAAIFVGKAIGKHPLAPSISPKKTWEGAMGNLIACVLVGTALGGWIGIGYGIGAACGLGVGVAGQAGDLFESYVKRKAGLKDSGNLLPGHGGIMDRIDSILFAAPAVALILFLLG